MECMHYIHLGEEGGSRLNGAVSQPVLGQPQHLQVALCPEDEDPLRLRSMSRRGGTAPPWLSAGTLLVAPAPPYWQAAPGLPAAAPLTLYCPLQTVQLG